MGFLFHTAVTWEIKMILLVILHVVPTETFQCEVIREACIENILTEIMKMRNYGSVFCSTWVVSAVPGIILQAEAAAFPLCQVFKVAVAPETTQTSHMNLLTLQ